MSNELALNKRSKHDGLNAERYELQVVWSVCQVSELWTMESSSLGMMLRYIDGLWTENTTWTKTETETFQRRRRKRRKKAFQTHFTIEAIFSNSLTSNVTTVKEKSKRKHFILCSRRELLLFALFFFFYFFFSCRMENGIVNNVKIDSFQLHSLLRCENVKQMNKYI